MEVLMVGTHHCSKCKRMAPIVEDYCSSNCIAFSYKEIDDVSGDVLDIIKSRRINSAPLLIIYRDDGNTSVLYGDTIMMELENI